MSENFNYLNEIINENNDLLKCLKGDLDDEEIKDTIFLMYANFLEMMDNVKDIRAELRQVYKFKEIQVKKWIKKKKNQTNN